MKLLPNNETIKAPPESWTQSCQGSLETSTTHIDDLKSKTAVLDYKSNPHDHEIWVQLQYGIVVCLTAVVELCYLLGRSSPPRPLPKALVFRGRVQQSMEELMDATGALSQEDLNYFDPVIGVSALPKYTELIVTS
jgi:hypothetical protein